MGLRGGIQHGAEAIDGTLDQILPGALRFTTQPVLARTDADFHGQTIATTPARDTGEHLVQGNRSGLSHQTEPPQPRFWTGSSRLVRVTPMPSGVTTVGQTDHDLGEVRPLGAWFLYTGSCG